jgi:flagellar biosynthetic protein FliO
MATEGPPGREAHMSALCRLATALILVSFVGAIGAAGDEPEATPPDHSLANQTKSLEPEPSPSDAAALAAPEKQGVANLGQIVLPPPKEWQSHQVKDEPATLAKPEDAEPAAESGVAASEIPARTVRNVSIDRERGDPTPWYRSGLLSLVAVLVVIALLAYLARRFVPSVRTMNGGAIEVLGRSHLASKQTLVLVRIGRRVLLLGTTGDRIATLCEVQDPGEVAELLVSASRGSQGANADQFSGALHSSATGFRDGDASAVEFVRGPSDELSRTKGRLQSLLGRLESMRESK